MCHVRDSSTGVRRQGAEPNAALRVGVMVREELWDGALALIGGMLAFGVYSIVEDAAAWMRRREFSRQCRRGASPLERKRLSIEPSHRRRVTIIRQMMCLCHDTTRTEPGARVTSAGARTFRRVKIAGTAQNQKLSENRRPCSNLDHSNWRIRALNLAQLPSNSDFRTRFARTLATA